MEKELKNKVSKLPHNPGVYKFLNNKGVVLYVGKAKDLKKRVAQYFGQDKRIQLPFLMNEAKDLDYIVTKNELEALYLENTLIKKFLPKYNIDLRDDRNFAFLKLNTSTQIPNFEIVRKITDKSVYFGPYSAVYKIKNTLDFIRKTFGLCGNIKTEKRPCFYYHLKKCPGVCAGEMSKEAYLEHIHNIASFLKGDRTKLYAKLTKQMKGAVKKRQFEKAASLRDQLKQFAILAEKQSAILPNKTNIDVWANYTEANSVCLYLLKVRLGKIIDTDSYVLKIKNLELQEQEATQFLEHYYLDSPDLPKEVLLSFKPVDVSLLEQALLTKTNKKIKFTTPLKGNKINLIKTATENARQTLKKALINAIGSEVTPKEILLELQKILNLPTLPLRIECYDNSNIQGSFPVGSMVVFKNGLPQKSEYRKFKFEGYTKPDDFAQMQEMLERRIKHLEINQEVRTWPKPDLIVIDGGKGQLGAVVKIFKKHKINIPVIGLAKRIEEIFLPGNSSPIILKHADAPLQLLQRLRDEAHRFAITFHKSRRDKSATKSALDTIPGIGPKTKKLLKQKFGTVAQIRATSTEELSKVIGAKLAVRIKNILA